MLKALQLVTSLGSHEKLSAQFEGHGSGLKASLHLLYVGSG